MHPISERFLRIWIRDFDSFLMQQNLAEGPNILEISPFMVFFLKDAIIRGRVSYVATKMYKNPLIKKT